MEIRCSMQLLSALDSPGICYADFELRIAQSRTAHNMPKRVVKVVPWLSQQFDRVA